jgi:hypothetical protein
LLVRAVDYTATDGTSVVLVTATTVGDYVEIITTATFSAANTYTQAAANAAFYPVTTTQIAGKNKIINGDFGIWQRGTSFTQTNGAYNADRFLMVFDGSGATRTVSRQTFTPGTAPVLGYEGSYFWRLNQSVAGTGGTYNVLQQKIEDVRTFAGQTVAISFWVKADAARTITFNAYQYFGTGGSSPVQAITNQPFSATTSWQRFTYTATIPSISGKTIGTDSFFSFEIQFPSNTIQTIDLWGIQVEAGSVATAFTTASGGSPQAELAMCQRYYYRTSGQAYGRLAIGSASTTTSAQIPVNLPVTMRTAPTSVDSSTLLLYDLVNLVTPTSVTLTSVAQSLNVGTVDVAVASGLTQFRPYLLTNNNSTSAYIGFSAEL